VVAAAVAAVEEQPSHMVAVLVVVEAVEHH
jgi:hypothetical protein